MLINIGENIRRCRTEQNLTQEQLAYELGVSAQAVSRWETGTTYPDIMLLPVIADFFHLTLDELMGREKELSQKERADFFEKVGVISQASGAEATVSRLLILLLCEDGKKEEAEQLVNDLPSFLCGREIMATYLYEGEAGSLKSPVFLCFFICLCGFYATQAILLLFFLI